jgi:hypothetical protein
LIARATLPVTFIPGEGPECPCFKAFLDGDLQYLPSKGVLFTSNTYENVARQSIIGQQRVFVCLIVCQAALCHGATSNQQ